MLDPPTPLVASPFGVASSASGTVRVTHLAKKALPMRHKTSAHHRNPLKKRSLKPHE
jgi:hypothetical protein